MKRFVKIVNAGIFATGGAYVPTQKKKKKKKKKKNDWKPLTIFVKRSVLVVWQDSECASDAIPKKPPCPSCPTIFQKA